KEPKAPKVKKIKEPKVKKVKEPKAPKVKKIKEPKVKKVKEPKAPKVKKMKTKKIKKTKRVGKLTKGNKIINQLGDVSFLYSADGTIQIDSYETFDIAINKGKAKARNRAKEINDYLNYWLKYWNTKTGALTYSGEEGDKKDDTITISYEFVMQDAPDRSFIEKDIEKILVKLGNKDGVVYNKTAKGFEIVCRQDVLFEFDSNEFKFGSMAILDILVDIAKEFKEKGTITINGYSQKSVIEGKAKKRALKWSRNIGKGIIKYSKINKVRFLYTSNEGYAIKPKISVTFYPYKIADITGKEKQAPKYKGLTVYKEFEDPDNHYQPTGWMGDTNDLSMSLSCKQDTRSGFNCIKVEYKARGEQGWAGIYWQNPMNNWGTKPGGINLTGAEKLTFWARGERGGERIRQVKIGGIKGEYGDSDAAWTAPITLGKAWKEYTIDLRGKDISSIIGGFSFVVNKEDNKYGATFYLDDIRFE
ncbi:MAG: hypothetical protein ABH857_01035, partial [Elusimicrobiota bacterium]